MEVERPVAESLTQNVQTSISDEELYLKVKELQSEIDMLKIQEDFIREEQKTLKKELIRAREEIKRIQAVPLVIGQFVEMIDVHHGKLPGVRIGLFGHFGILGKFCEGLIFQALISSTGGSNMYVRVLSILDREKLKPNCSIAMHRYSNAIVDILPSESDSSIQMMKVGQKQGFG